MDKINKRYNSLVMNYKEIEKGTLEQEIHDKRVILRRIFPILAAFSVKSSKVKNGEKAFKLFGELRDIQIQIIKLESLELTPVIAEYLTFLKVNELKSSEKVFRFCKKKELVFPSIKGKKLAVKSKIYKKANESLAKLLRKIQARNNDSAYDIHKIRIEFKKFRYVAETLLSIENINNTNLEKIKDYQDLLGEIQDYKILMAGITRFYNKRKLDSGEIIGLFEKNQKNLIEKFDKDLDKVIQMCRAVISLDNDVSSLDEDKVKPIELLSKSDYHGLMDVIVSLKQQPEMLLDDIVAAKEKVDIPVIENVLPIQVRETPTRKNTIKGKAVSTDKKEPIAAKSVIVTKKTAAKKKEQSPTEKVTTNRKPKVTPKAVVKTEDTGGKQ